MTEIGFYHLTRTEIGAALPRLLEKALAAGHRILVRAPDETEVERLTLLLWTYTADSFLPHGSAADGRAAEQPIYLTARDENPNGATLLAQLGGVDCSEIDHYARVIDLFDGNREHELAAARQRWTRYKAAGHQLVYLQQQANGGWERRA